MAGDKVIIYHAGEKTLTGLAEVAGQGREDPSEPKSYLREFKFLKKFAFPLVTLENIKAEKQFSDGALVRQGRLSVMPVPDKIIKWLKEEKQLDL